MCLFCLSTPPSTSLLRDSCCQQRDCNSLSWAPASHGAKTAAPGCPEATGQEGWLGETSAFPPPLLLGGAVESPSNTSTPPRLSVSQESSQESRQPSAACSRQAETCAGAVLSDGSSPLPSWGPTGMEGGLPACLPSSPAVATGHWNDHLAPAETYRLACSGGWKSLVLLKAAPC